MKNWKFLTAMLLVGVTLAACQGGRRQPQLVTDGEDTTTLVADTSLYGVCGEATAMHTLQLLTDLGDTLSIALIDSQDRESDVLGGLMAGDRMAVTAHQEADGRVADKVVNLTTLLGRWTSIDKNFEIVEGGTVRSNMKAESHPWTSWKMVNGRLVLDSDTFDIASLGADSLYLENDKGIFVYRRKK